ncbi:ATP-binding protein [Actinokineospora globicatena]|uniref:Helix-turn-helix transcriptional regulator n=1 Tax=Actinokineospora globicatena TaxID=103729 RepID=A0A9W6QIS6_9PSEU|nr:AAA family ATPase [Actinokineospora globicatena]GLW91208.1 helix-turn-helix transcriptional regulator [Actinokineospora globicatena]
MVNGFFGRAAELRLLAELLADAARGRPATVVLDGEPGTGKTRLVQEFARTARASGAFVLAGGCLELAGEGIPYGPLTEALRSLVRTEGAQRAGELAGPAWSELSDLISDFTAGPGPAPGYGAQTRVFGAVSRLLDHLGSRQPLVLVFEDVHWADTATLDLIAYLVLTKSDQRMMLVCSHRSGLRTGHPLRVRLTEPEFVRRASLLTLRPFSRKELRAFVAAITGEDISPERADEYFALSEGNPYFTEQLVAESGSGATRVPPSVDDLMRERLARLGPEAGRLTKVAAVAGRRVSDALLARVAGFDDTALEAALTECLGNRVLVEDREDESYRFQHALLREAAYGTVLTRERKRLHAQFAAALAEDAPANPRLLPELAYHWFAADDVPQALRASVGAGDLAMRLRAFTEAETQYGRALALWPRLPDADRVAGTTLVRLLGVAANAARWAGHLRQCLTWARWAVDAGAGTGPVVLGRLHERLSSYLWEAGYDEESLAELRAADRLLAEVRPSAAGSRVRAALATAAVKSGRCAEALALAQQAEDEAEAAGAKSAVGRARNSRGLALSGLGEHTPAIAAVQDALAIAEAEDHLEDQLRARGNLGVCLERAGRVAESAAQFQTGLAKTREFGLLDSRQSALLANNACATLFQIGEWDQAVVLVDEVLRYHPARETTFQRLTKAEVDLATGRLDEAERLLRSVRELPSAQPRFLSPLYRCLAELAAARGDLDAALDTVRHGIEVVAACEDPLLVLQLCAYGLRLTADWPDPGPPARLREFADDMAARAPSDGDAETRVLVALCAAERARADRADTATMWTDLAESWSALERPYPKAYAWARAADAAARAEDRPTAIAAATEAAGIADLLGAAPLAELVKGIRRAHRLVERAPTPARRPFGLSDREVQVIALVAQGLTNSQIATRLRRATSTVANQRASAMRRLKAKNAPDAVRIAREHGLLAD